MLPVVLRRIAVIVSCVLVGLSAAQGAPTPLFTHTDKGPVQVMDGETGAILDLSDSSATVREFVARVNALLREGASAGTAALSDAIGEGDALRARLDTTLVGTLYLEEAVRRLRRLRLARVPVATTQVVRTHRPEAPARFAKPLYLRTGVDDLQVDYATFAACLELAQFPADSGPREVNVEPDGTLWTRVNGQPLAFDIVPYGERRMLLRSVIIGASRSLGLKDKLQVSRFVLDHCV